MLSQEHLPQHRFHSFFRSRTARTVAAVVLAHAGLVWLLDRGVLNTRVPVVVDDNIIMASLVTEVAAAPVPAPISKPLPVVPKAPPQNRPVPKTLAQPATAFAQAPASTSVAPAPFSPAATQAPAASVEVASAADVASPSASPVAAVVATAGGARNGNPASAAPAAVVLPSSDADYLNNPAPVYPRMSRRLGEQGTVVVRVLISAEGRAEKAEVRTSSGYSRLDDAALDTVQRWRYMPGKRGGVPEAMWFNVPIRFVLD